MAETKTAKKKHGTVKRIFQVLFFVLLTVLALIYVLHNDPSKTFEYLGSADFFPVIVAILVILSTLVLDGIALTLLTRIYQPRYHFYQGLLNVMTGQSIGVYLKASAPLVQATTFSKQGVGPAESASVLTMNYLLYQFSLFFYSLVIVIVGYPIIKDAPLDLLGGMPIFYIVLVGLLMQLFFLLMILGLAYFRGLHRFVLNTGINILAKLHLLADPEGVRRKKTIQFATYRIEMKRLFKHKGRVVAIVVLNLLKQFLLGIVPFILFWSLGADLNLLNFGKSLCGTGYVNVIGSFITVGAPEISFQAIFSYFLAGTEGAENLASACNLLWRSLTFYLLFLIGIITLASYRGKSKKYVLLSDTGTIFDLEAINLTKGDEEDKKYLQEIYQKGKKEEPPLITEDDVVASFEELRKTMEEKPVSQSLSDDETIAKVLQEENKRLAEIEKETAQSRGEPTSDPEIRAEARREFTFLQHRKEKKKARKEARLAKKKAKKEARERELLNSLQPEGSHVEVDEKNGLHILGPGYHEERSEDEMGEEDAETKSTHDN